MKKLLKWALIGIGIMVGIGTISVLFISQSKPAGKNRVKADELANQMLSALDKPAFDTIKYLSWNFADRNQYLWDKQGGKCIVTFGDNKVVLDLSTKTGKILSGNLSHEDAIEKAWANWCNDSFWMMAPFKAFDPGTERYIVDDEGKQGLEVKYSSGGVTPGDSFVWFLDENKVPESYKMWVKIIPIGGTYASWENWITLPSGAKVATLHRMKMVDLEMKDVKEGNSPSDFGYKADIFNL
jgi:hypothetical protein